MKDEYKERLAEKSFFKKLASAIIDEIQSRERFDILLRLKEHPHFKDQCGKITEMHEIVNGK